MKQILLTIAALLAAFSGGAAGAWLVGKHMQSEAIDDWKFTLTNEPEGRVRMSIVTLRLLKAGDTAKAIEINCRMARSALPLLHHYQNDTPERKQSVNRLLKIAEETITPLEQSGDCGP